MNEEDEEVDVADDEEEGDGGESVISVGAETLVTAAPSEAAEEG